MSGYEVNAGYAGALGVAFEETPGVAVTPPDTFLEIESETLDETLNRVQAPGIVGSRSQPKTRNVATTKDAKGGLRINGTRGADLEFLLQAALGNYASGTGYVGDTLPSFTVVKRVAGKHDVFAGCKAASLKLESASDNQALQADLEAVAMSRADGDANDLGTPEYDDDPPFVHCGLTLKVANLAVRPKKWNVTIANPLREDAFYNSQSRLAMPENDDRKVSGEITLDANAENYTRVLALWEAGTFGELRAEYTNGIYVLTLVLPYCQFSGKRPMLGGKSSVELPVTFAALSSAAGASDEIIVYKRAA